MEGFQTVGNSFTGTEMQLAQAVANEMMRDAAQMVE